MEPCLETTKMGRGRWATVHGRRLIVSRRWKCAAYGGLSSAYHGPLSAYDGPLSQDDEIAPRTTRRCPEEAGVLPRTARRRLGGGSGLTGEGKKKRRRTRRARPPAE